MPDIQDMTPGEVLAEASVADFIKSLGLSIADAQRALDENSVAQMGEFIKPREGLAGKSLLDMGMAPAFYHYQHADITCSMQIQLKVEEDLTVGLNLNGSFNDAQTSNNSNTENTTETESGSTNSTSTRSAEITLTSASSGALTVGGQDFALQGASTRERIANLSDQIRGNQDVTRAIPSGDCSPVVPTPTTTDTTGKVVCKPNSVAFVGGGFENGIIRIRENPAAADSPQTFRLNGSTSLDVTRSTSVDAYAEKVKDAIDATAFFAFHFRPGTPVSKCYFDVDRADIRPDDDALLLKMARLLVSTGLSAKVNGYASRTASDAHNQALSERRSAAVMQRLIQYGVPAGQLATQSFGETEWRNQGIPDETEMQPHRVVHLVIDSPDHFVWVDGDLTNQLDAVTPNQIGTNDTGDNGFIYVYDALGMADLNGKTVTIKGQVFTLSGDIADPGIDDTGAAFATNLAQAVNANSSVGVEATANGNVAHLCNEGDEFSLILVTTSNRNIQLSSSETITIARQFNRTSTTNLTQQGTGNRTVAVGASLDVGYGRKYETSITGNSTISARLVSLPAPPQFLETIKTFLSQEG